MKDNKLILDFLGITAEFPEDSPLFNIIYDYHKDWNKLMEVVEKIGTIEDTRYSMAGNFEIQISNTYVWVDPPIGDRIYFSGNSPEDRERPLIDKVYEGVLVFIKFYNNL